MASEFIVKTLDKFLIIRTRFFNKDRILFKYSAKDIYTSTIEIKNTHVIINVG